MFPNLFFMVAAVFGVRALRFGLHCPGMGGIKYSRMVCLALCQFFVGHVCATLIFIV